MTDPTVAIAQLPNIFQANLTRLYLRVIEPSLHGLTTYDRLDVGETYSGDVFFARAAAQVDNYTSNEAAKAFTLVVSGLFERQMRIWAARQFPTDVRGVQLDKFRDLLSRCASHAGFDIADMNMAEDLEEAFLVANVVRHGDGGSLKNLQASHPALFAVASDYLDLLPNPSPASEQVRIKPDDVKRYVRAGVRFWGHANTIPFAQKDPYF